MKDTDVRWQSASDVAEMGSHFVEGRDQLTELRGAFLRRSLRAGTPLHAQDVIKPGAPGFLVNALGPGMRALSIAVDPVSGVSGFVSPGDRVDVILLTELEDRDKVLEIDPRRFSETIVQDLRVLAIAQVVDQASGQPTVGDTATLEVTPKQAEILALGAQMGVLSLVLRGVHPGEYPEIGDSYTSDLGVSLGNADIIARAMRGGLSQVRTGGGGQSAVKFYRGAESTSLSFPD